MSHRVEHELRYALAAPLIRAARLWVDLGCGSGAAAAGALGDRLPAAALLVDVDGDALDEASGALAGARTLRADLATAEGTAAVREAVAADDIVVTCFETLAHLADFAPCVELLLDLPATVVLSVPNDAFWAIENPNHPTTWGQGAVEELRRVLPADHVVLDQIPLAASAIVGAGDADLAVGSVRVTEERVPSHHVLAFGPGAERLAPLAGAAVVDARSQRRRERERDSELEVLAARVAELERAR
jgi:SAM-dependent methyltransferase